MRMREGGREEGKRDREEKERGSNWKIREKKQRLRGRDREGRKQVKRHGGKGWEAEGRADN